MSSAATTTSQHHSIAQTIDITMQRRPPAKGDSNEREDRKPSPVQMNNSSDEVEQSEKARGIGVADEVGRPESDNSSDGGSGSDTDSSQSELSEIQAKTGAKKAFSPTERITTPTEFDVLFGRGKPYQMHPGNLRLHSVVKSHKDRYTNARRHEKLAIATEVVNLIKNGGPKPARFLKLAPGGSYWVEQTTKRATEKVGHALRGKPRSRRGSWSENLESGRDVRPFAAMSNSEMAGLDDSDRFPQSERSERRILLRRISQLDTVTLNAIVQQYASGETAGGAASASVQATAATGGINPVVPVLSGGLAGTLLAGGIGTGLSSLTGSPGLLIPLNTLGALPREASVDPALAAALLQQSQIHQAAALLSTSGQAEQQRLVEAYLQQARQNGSNHGHLAFY